jgi:hypothetical protein
MNGHKINLYYSENTDFEKLNRTNSGTTGLYTVRVPVPRQIKAEHLTTSAAEKSVTRRNGPRSGRNQVFLQSRFLKNKQNLKRKSHKRKDIQLPVMS